MSFKLQTFCVQVFFIQSAHGQCISPAPESAAPAYNIPYDIPYGLGPTYELPVPFLNEPYSYAASPFLNEPFGNSAPFLNEPYSYVAPLLNEVKAYDALLVNEPYNYGAPSLNEPKSYDVPFLNEPYSFSAPILNGPKGYDDPFLNYPYGYSTPLLNEPYSHGAPFLNEPYGLPYASRSTCSTLEYSPTCGGSLAISSTSGIPPVGIAVVSDNIFEGSLAVVDELPLIGTVAMDSFLPSADAGLIDHECGNGINAYSPIGSFSPSFATTGLEYDAGWVDRACSCGL